MATVVPKQSSHSLVSSCIADVVLRDVCECCALKSRYAGSNTRAKKGEGVSRSKKDERKKERAIKKIMSARKAARPSLIRLS